MAECPFCKIVAGERDAHVLVETDRTVAFLDGNPATPGHTLVVPRQHCEHLFAADETLPQAVFRTVQRVASAMNRTLDAEGVSTFYTSGPLAGTITHAHVHLVPRYEDDNITLTLSRNALDDEEGEALARLLRDVV